jgi:anti-sigma factor RsiW
MKHFSTNEWIDFVNERTANPQRTEMQQHLEEGCSRCTKTLAMWQRVRRDAASEARFQPPAGALRTVKAAFAASGLAGTHSGGRKRRALELLFDSLLQPALVGARSVQVGTRQVLYRAEPYQIDVQIEATPSGTRLMVTGQILDVSRSETVARNVRVTLSNRRGSVAQIVTNEFGEFEGVVENSGDLELSFGGKRGRPVVISLRDTLARSAGGVQ